jgi:hypothetical protein
MLGLAVWGLVGLLVLDVAMELLGHVLKRVDAEAEERGRRGVVRELRRHE